MSCSTHVFGALLLLAVGHWGACGPSDSSSVDGARGNEIGSIAQPLSFPSITELSPTHGSPRGHYVLTISGTNFLGASCELNFGGTRIAVKPTSSSRIDLNVPALPLGTRPLKVVIHVSCGGLPSINSAEFWYIEDQLSLLPPLTAKGAAGQRDLGIADLDGDGQPDIVVANPSAGELALYRGLGSGKFEQVLDPFVSALLAVPNAPYAVAIGDLDRDGKVDIAVTQRGASNVTILWNNTSSPGAWNFTSDTRSIAAAASSDAKAIAIADLNGDTWDDLIVAHPAANSLSLLAVTAGRTVASSLPITIPSPAPPAWAVESMVVADLNNDGANELITLSNGGKTLTILPDVTRWFTIPWQWKTFTDQYGSLAVSDLDRDGRQEILLGASAASHVLVLGVDAEGSISGAASKRFATSGPVQSMAVADVDGDTYPDVVAGLAASADSSIDVLSGDSKVLLKPAQKTDLGSRGGYLRVSDMDGDGLPDAIVLDVKIPLLSDGANLLTVRRNLGTGFEPLWLMNTGGPQPSLITHLDVNNDGYIDLAVADTAINTLVTLPGDGSGSFRSSSAQTKLSVLPGCIAAASYTGDAYDDLIVCRSEPTNHGIDLWSGAADGTFKRQRAINTIAIPQALAKDEFGIGLDGNAFPDFVMGGFGAYPLVTMIGQPPATLDFTTKNYTAGRGASSLVMANFGRLNNDVLVSATLDDAVFLLRGDGKGNLGGASRVASVAKPGVLATADFNGDGNQDFVALSADTGKLTVFLGDGAGKFSAPPDTELDFGKMSTPSAMAIGDFNRDGVPDLAIRFDGSPRIAFLLGLGDGRFIAAPSEILPESSGALETVDIDGDGALDLVFSVSRSVSGTPTGRLISLLTYGP